MPETSNEMSLVRALRVIVNYLPKRRRWQFGVLLGDQDRAAGSDEGGEVEGHGQRLRWRRPSIGRSMSASDPWYDRAP